MSDTLPIEVLACGTYRTRAGTPFTLTTDHLDEACANFTKLREHVKPPIKLGHGEQRFVQQPNGQPALGWVSSLERRGDKVVAHVADMPAALKGMIAKRRYRRVSPELTLAFQHSDYEKNLKSGVSGVVVEAVSLLGADIPQIPNLADLDALATFLGAQALQLSAETAPRDPATMLDADEECVAPRSPAESAPMADKEAAMAEQKTAEDVAALSKRLEESEAARVAAETKADEATAALSAKVAEQDARIAALTKANEEAAAREQLALSRQRTLEAVQFADAYCQPKCMKVLPAQKPALAALHRALAEGGSTIVLSAADAETLHCAKADYTGVALLTAFLDAAPDHKAILSVVPNAPATVGAEALEGDNYEAALAFVASEEKLTLSIPTERAQAAQKLIQRAPKFRHAS